VERLSSLPSDLYYTYIKPIEGYVPMKTISRNEESFQIWHARLGHPGLSMMRRIINNCASHDVRGFPNPENFIFTGCAKGKLITRPSLVKIRDLCSFIGYKAIFVYLFGPVGPFRYFIVLMSLLHYSFQRRLKKRFQRRAEATFSENEAFPEAVVPPASVIELKK